MGLQPRAIGAAQICVKASMDGVTRLANLRQLGSSKLVLPLTYRHDMEAVLVNTAGGITGGDLYNLDIRVEANAALALTTQAAERAYRSQLGEVGRVASRATVDSGARLQWLPQELILFDRCALRRRLEIDLAQGAELLMVEPVVFGRTAMNETLSDILFEDRIRITRDGLPVYADGMDLHGGATDHLARKTIADGAGAMASVVLVADTAERYLGKVRSMLPPTAGASLLADDLLVVRLLACDGFMLRQSLMPVLDLLSHNTLPTSWRL